MNKVYIKINDVNFHYACGWSYYTIDCIWKGKEISLITKGRYGLNLDDYIDHIVIGVVGNRQEMFVGLSWGTNIEHTHLKCIDDIAYGEAIDIFRFRKGSGV